MGILKWFLWKSSLIRTVGERALMEFGIVYVATNKANSKQYVGLTTLSLKKRLSCHLTGIDSLFKRALKKYGVDGFEFEVKRYPVDQLGEMEKFWIKSLNSKRPLGYNLSDGGMGGCHRKPHTEQTKIFLSKSRTQFFKTHPDKLPVGEKNGMFRKHHSPETLKKMLRTGWNHSEETKIKIGNGNRGKIYTEETRKKISDWHKGRPLSEIHKQALRIPHKHPENCKCPAHGGRNV